MPPLTPVPWTVTALNLPEHAGNPIHTDEGARAAGFPRALVAGVTTYAYLTHPVAAAWGLDWLERGGGEVRFRSPVFEHDEVTCDPEAEPDGDAVLVSARCAQEPDRPRATFRAILDAGPAPDLGDGEDLPEIRVVLGGELGWEYGLRAGDDLSIYADRDLVHPAVWPAVANRLFHLHLVRGSWIHTRSVVRHHALVAAGSEAVVRSRVVRRFRRSGERAVADIRIEVGGVAVATLEHEAIIDLTG